MVVFSDIKFKSATDHILICSLYCKIILVGIFHEIKIIITTKNSFIKMSDLFLIC